MAMKPVTFTGDWDKISGKAIAGAFTGKLNINLRRATTLNAMLVKKAIRRKIQGRQQQAAGRQGSAVPINHPQSHQPFHG